MPGNGSNGSGCYFAIVIAIAIFILIGFGGCVQACVNMGDSGLSDSGSSNTSRYGDRAAAEEASHYHYDANGHIYDDRD